MQNSEREQFEESWKSAFDGAEMAPSNKTWDSIERELASTEHATMKRRVVFYQRLAAATVLFALVSGAYTIYIHKGGAQEVAAIQTQAPSATNSNTTPLGQAPTPSISNAAAENSSTRAKNHEISMGRKNVNSNKPDYQSGKGDAGANTPVPLVAKDDAGMTNNTLLPDEGMSADESSNIVIASAHQKSGQTQGSADSAQQQIPTLLSADEINAIAEAKAKEDEKKEKHDPAPWLGLGGAAGSYAPNATVSGGNFVQADQSPTSYSASQNIPRSYSDNVGSAYSAGVSAGMRIAKRWVIQSGLNYINQKIDYTTNFVGISSSNKAMAMTSEYMMASSMDMAVTNPYTVSSASEILSVPVQAGFLIIDRKFGWQLNTGVSTDFLIRNTLTDKSGTRGKVSEGAGENSPYRSVNGAMLLNTELSYRIGDHYRLALVPGFRYSFKPMLKENVTGTPLVLDIGFRFKYLFN